MSVVNLYNLLECTSINGTWTRLSATGPAAPNTYNGTINLSSSPTGLYEYQYTTNDNKTVKVSIDWVTAGVNRIHDSNSGAINIPITNISNINVSYTDNNLDYCASNGFNKPTASSTTDFDLPTYFPNTISGDLWYQALLPVCKEAYEVNVSIQRVDDLLGVGLVVHVYYPDLGTFGVKQVKTSGFSNTSNIATVSVGVNAKTRMILLIRAFTNETTLGTYTLNITSSHTCTPSEVDLGGTASAIFGSYQETFVASGTQTTFEVTKGGGTLPTNIDNILVLRNGQYLQSAYFSHNAVNGTVTLTFTPFAGEEITIIWFDLE